MINELSSMIRVRTSCVMHASSQSWLELTWGYASTILVLYILASHIKPPPPSLPLNIPVLGCQPFVNTCLMVWGKGKESSATGVERKVPWLKLPMLWPYWAMTTGQPSWNAQLLLCAPTATHHSHPVHVHVNYTWTVTKCILCTYLLKCSARYFRTL